MAVVTIQKVFATEADAHDFAVKYARDMWGYDPLIRITAIGGQWVADISRQATCD
jgi:hypothetical protein